MPSCPSRSSLLAAALLALAACGTTPEPKPPDVKQPPAGPSVGAVERVGGYSAGQARAVLTGSSSTVLVGLTGSPLDPKWLGLEGAANDKGFFIPSGLLVADAATGKVRVYTAADGLPEMSYDDGVKDWGRATAPIFAMTWLDPDHAFAAASGHFVVRGELGATGNWTFRSTTLRAEGSPADAFAGAVASAGDELFVGTDQGVAVLDAKTLDLKRWIDFAAAASGGVSCPVLAAATVGGSPAVVALLGVPGRDPRQLAILRPGEKSATTLPLDSGESAVSVLGAPGFTAIGMIEQDGRGSVRALTLGGGVPALAPLVSADALSASTFGPLIPHRLAWDANRGMLLVGGELRSAGGGGFVTVSVAEDGSAAGRATDALDRADPAAKLLPKQVESLAVDALGRWYLAGKSLCSEHKLGVVGLLRVEQGDSGFRAVRPWVSGVRTLAQGPDGATWLGLRDELPGLVCDGATVQTGACRLRADGACELYTPFVNADLTPFTPVPPVSRFAFDEPRHGLALATRGEALFLRRGPTSRVVSTQLDENLSLDQTSAAFGADGNLWVGSETAWQYLPDVDVDKVNARSPHGLGWLEIKDDATTGAKKRYVRVASDNLPNDDVAGLPSNQVWDVLPLEGTRHALVALGVERGPRTYDHLLAEADRHGIRGGLAVVDDAKVRAIAAPSGTSFGDVVALAKDASGKLWALDAEAGVFTVDAAAGTARQFAAPAWTSPVRATSLAVDADGRVAVGTTRGAWVYGANGGVSRIYGGEHGTTWALTFLGKGFLAAGTDEGVVRAALDGAAAVSAPAELGPRELWEFDWGCNGTAGCACSPDRPCSSDTACDYDPATSSGTCAKPDPCIANPGSPGCACHADEDCGSGLACACEGRDCSCKAAATCANDCTCTGPGTTADGCPTGSTCQSGFAGQSCVATGPGPGPGPGPGISCGSNCTCTGPGTTTDGCPSGQSCTAGPHGSSCR